MPSKQTERLLLSCTPTVKRCSDIKKYDRLYARIVVPFETCILLDPLVVKTSYTLSKYLKRALINRGPKGLVELSKALFQWSFQTYGESETVLPLYNIRMDRRGRPCCLIPLLNSFERSRDPGTFQLMLSVLSIHREYPGSGKLDPKVLLPITDSNGDIRVKLENSASLRRSFIETSRMYLGKYDSSSGGDPLRGPVLYTNSFGPQSIKGEIPLTEYPIFNPSTKTLDQPMKVIRKSSLMVAEAEAYALTLDTSTYSAWLEWCRLTDQDDLVSLQRECASKFKGKVQSPCNKLGFKPDKALKNRPFAMVNYWIQLSLGGIHTWAYGLLRKDRANECFDHRQAFLRCVHSIDGRTLQGCLDERAATDLFPDVPISWFITSRFGSSVGKSWLTLMRSLEFYVHRSTPVKWGCGQPLGTKGSWPLYNTASEVVDLMPQLTITGKFLPVTLRVGDDTRYLSRFWVNTIRNWRVENFGSDFGLSKGILSKTAVEICKQYYIKEGEVTPLSSTLVNSSFGDYASFGMLIKRLHESSNVPYNHPGLSLLASASSLSKRRDGTYGVRRSFLDNRLGIIAFYQLNNDDYKVVVKLITLTMILRSLREAAASFAIRDSSFASRVMSSSRAKAISSLRKKAIDVMTDPNPSLDWNFVRRLLPSPPKWLTVNVAQNRGLSRVVDFVSMSPSQATQKLDVLFESIEDKTGYI